VKGKFSLVPQHHDIKTDKERTNTKEKASGTDEIGSLDYIFFV
jgi:hypothetical protein